MDATLSRLSSWTSAGLRLRLRRFQQTQVVSLQQQVTRNRRGGFGSVTAFFDYHRPGDLFSSKLPAIGAEVLAP